MTVRDWLRRRGQAKPFLRWAGGKQPFLQRYASRFPVVTGRYFEPFLGSGSVFFYLQRAQLQPLPSILGDSNRQLIVSFLQIRDNAQAVIDELGQLIADYLASENPTAFYRTVRDMYNEALPGVSAATFIFLNRTCWNGLYRLNRAGAFNVPHGRPSGNMDAFMFPSAEDLLNCSAALQSAELSASSWDNLIGDARPGDFIFLDPPYYSELADRLQKYSSVSFSRRDHLLLAKQLGRLSERGIDFLLTNSGDDEIESVYQNLGLDVERVAVPRFISSKTDLRVSTIELIVRPKGRGLETSTPIQIECDIG